MGFRGQQALMESKDLRGLKVFKGSQDLKDLLA